MNEEEFEELFGNTPFENIKKIQHYIDKNYIPVSLVEEKIKELIKEGRHYNANKIGILQELLEKRK